jgi:uncharacterized delta-60 repeat protein
VEITLSGAPVGLTAGPLVLAPGVTSGALNLTMSPTAAPGDVVVSIIATSGELEASTDLRVVLRGRPGTLDRRLGTDGIQIIDFGRVYRVLPLDDGSVILAGVLEVPSYRAAVAKLTPEGAPDASFGEAGWLANPWESGGVEGYLDVTLSGDGQLLASGYSYQGMDGQLGILTRFDRSGDLDPMFGIGGKVTIGAADGGSFFVRTAVVADDGRVLVGAQTPSTFEGLPYLARLTADGTVDPTFGTEGYLPAPVQPWHTGGRVERIVAHPDGTFAAIGSLDYDYYDLAAEGLLWRFDVDGDATAFEAVYLPLGEQSGTPQLTAIDLDSAGRWLVAGETGLDGTASALCSRYLEDGLLDVTFAGEGTVAQPADAGAYTQVVEDAGGRVVVAHHRYGRLLVHRYTAAGALDATFGSAGEVLIDPDTLVGTYISDPGTFSIAVLLDGRLLIAVSSFGGSSSAQSVVLALWD